MAVNCIFSIQQSSGLKWKFVEVKSDLRLGRTVEVEDKTTSGVLMLVCKILLENVFFTFKTQIHLQQLVGGNAKKLCKRVKMDYSLSFAEQPWQYCQDDYIQGILKQRRN